MKFFAICGYVGVNMSISTGDEQQHDAHRGDGSEIDSYRFTYQVQYACAGTAGRIDPIGVVHVSVSGGAPDYDDVVTRTSLSDSHPAVDEDHCPSQDGDSPSAMAEIKNLLSNEEFQPTDNFIGCFPATSVGTSTRLVKANDGLFDCIK